MCELRLEHDDVKLPLFSALLAKCQLRRKENMCWAQTRQSRVCVPKHMLGCMTRAQGGSISFVQGHYGGAVWGEPVPHQALLWPLSTCVTAPMSSRIGCLMLEGRHLFLPEA